MLVCKFITRWAERVTSALIDWCLTACQHKKRSICASRWDISLQDYITARHSILWIQRLSNIELYKKNSTRVYLGQVLKHGKIANDWNIKTRTLQLRKLINVSASNLKIAHNNCKAETTYWYSIKLTSQTMNTSTRTW